MDYLIEGRDYLKKYPDFKLVGRDNDLERLTAILMRKHANSVLLVGPGGVGCTALCLGIQARKNDPDAPFDIVTKRIFWLDTDQLFSSGDTDQISKAFATILSKLKKTSDSILIIEDTKDFIEAARNSGCNHFINSLNSAVKNGDTQAIFEIRDEDLEYVLKSHSDMRECYTMMDLAEPNGEALTKIIEGAVKSLFGHHNIKISQDAIDTAIEITNKYRVNDMGLSRAQPERSTTLLDRALSTYRLNAHKMHPEVPGYLLKINATTDENLRRDYTDKIAALNLEFANMQAQIRQLFMEQREGENAILELEDRLIELREKPKPVENDADPAKAANFIKNAFSGLGGMETPEIMQTQQMISKIQSAVDEIKKKFKELTSQIDDKLCLTREIVLQEFSRISGISASKLSEDEMVKLKSLEDDIKKRIFGQDYTVRRLVDAVKTAKVGRRNNKKPQASFMFLGPSGVGKTEIAKVLALCLMDDESALTRFDMSEYMEKHAVAKLIGAPPGYEGFEAGGILTNAMRKNPNRILLFDEIEKANDDVFNIFLQILSDGRLTDNVGRTVSFADAIILMTTNIGQTHFLNDDLSKEESEALAIEELNGRYRGEFLNRFAGRQNIICFNKLGLDSIEKIVSREIQDIELTYREKNIKIEIDQDSLKAFCKDHYNPIIGARGLPGYIQAKLEPEIVNTIVENPNFVGTFRIGYDTVEKEFTHSLEKE